MAETTETLLSMKLEENSWNINTNTINFVEDKELTVTITLREYRELVKNDSVKDSKIDELNHDRWKLQDEVKKLKEKNSELTNKIAEMFTVDIDVDDVEHSEEKEN